MEFAADTIVETPATVAARSSADGSQRVRWVFCLIAAAVVVAALVSHGGSVLHDPDNWWHVRVGLDLLSSHVFPTVDTYSYTFAGHPWIAKEWLGQILLALAYQAAGWNGVSLLAIAAIALMSFFLAWYLSLELKPLLAVGLTILLAFLVSWNYLNARPFIFTFPIVVVWTAELFRAARNEQAPPLWLLPLLCLWANLHASFTFGFVIAFFAGLDLLERTRLSKPGLLARWIGFGLLCPLVTLLNPYGVKAIVATFTVAHGNEALPFIGEWRAFDAGQEVIHEGLLLLVIFGVLVSRLRIGWAKGLLFVATLHLFLTHVRFAYLPFLLVPIALAADVAQQYPALSARKWAAEPRDRLEQFFMRHCRLMSAAIVALFVAAAGHVIFVAEVAPSDTTSASGALDFAEKHNLQGNVLNSYNFGGSLIFHGIKTYIDGRTDQLFLDGFMKRDRATMSTDGKHDFEALLKQYAITWTLLLPDDGRIPFLQEMPDWHKAYSDKNAVIYQRNK
jgi:hypothetical protein